LFTLLVAGEERAAARAAIEELEEELRSTRRLLRERRDGIPGRARKEGGPGSGRDGEGQGRRPQGSPSIIGQHPDVLEILALIDRIAPTSAAVLITGESGTGKELIAREIHEQSPWSDAPFISENCGAITETLLEMELFGSVKGAFTGADQDRPGLFEITSGGTLFLDEIGDTSPGLQKKLLRVLQESKVRRVGGNELIPVKVRVVSATNRDLFAEVRAGNFREDLFYRLNVINIMLPALRDRREDIPLLAEHFLQQLNDESGIEKRIPPALLEALLTHSWPGNIRELQNEVRRCYALSPLELDPGNLSPRVGAPQERPGRQPFELDAVLEKGSLRAATEDLEQEVLAAALKRFRGNRAVICSKLKIPKTTLYSKLKRYGLTDE
ncbi:MAG: sigma-54 interaction domain-containing protein, partial [Planctomycetota bacterium]